jgi:hypothetical protein
MGSMSAHELVIPAAVFDWLGPLLGVLMAVVVLWAVLAILSYLKRRAYGLSPVETGGRRDIKPDFLKVDHAARQAQVKRGERLAAEGAAGEPAAQYAKALSITRIAGIFLAISTFVTAAVFAVMRIEIIEAAWQKYSVWERFVAIVEEYPVGFGIAAIIILQAFVRMVLTLRTNR